MRTEYISNELVHWTGRQKTDEQAFAVLRAICEEETLLLSYCPTYVQPAFQKKAAMVCFTDIPLKHSREHCTRFGRFGIAFSKAAMMRYGANPVLYTTATHFARITSVNSLLEQMRELEKDRPWRAEVEPYTFTEDQTVALLEVVELLQEYSYKGGEEPDRTNYYQREWRLAFNSLPFAGGSSIQQPGMSDFRIRNGHSQKTFKFSPSDVEFLIVPLRFWLRARALGRAMGCKVKAYEFAVGV